MTTNKITFTVPGTAVPWHRPGRNRFTGATFCHSEDQRWQKIVRNYSVLCRPLELPTNPVILMIEFVMPRPKCHKTSIHHIKKPDLDNLAKNIKDALTGSMYRDDSQVYKAHFEKRYCRQEEPHVNITLEYV
jgi:Holliday junction resolvase RusA-like endonuclease